MILTDSAILKQMELGNITLTPFDPRALGSNSYDLHLSPRLKVYRGVCYVNHNVVELAPTPDNWDRLGMSPRELSILIEPFIDSKADNPTLDLIIPEAGLVLQPGILYLGTTTEFTRTRNLVPYLEGKSSIGRLGIKVHVTAGKGDIGFYGHWTLEIEVTHPVKVYPGMAFAQLSYFRPEGFCLKPYDAKQDAKYNNASDEPVASRNNLNFGAADSNAAFRERFADSGIAGLPTGDDE